MLSAIVLTKNEEANIEKCLNSLYFCDELIVIDDFSSDKTLEVCQKHKAIIFQRHLNNDFAAQRNFGLRKPNENWVLFVDADEAVSKQLAQEIETAIKSDKNGFYLKRQDFFLGRYLKFGETGQLKLLRLGRKTSGEWHREVHEYWKISGEKGQLVNPLYHCSHLNIFEFIKTINFYTDIDAKHMHHNDKIEFNLARVFLNPIGKFFQNYFFRLGFLDGFPGFVMAFMMSFYSLTVRVKLYDPS